MNLTDEQLETSKSSVLGFLFHTSESAHNVVQFNREGIIQISTVLQELQELRSDNKRLQAIEQALIDFQNNMLPSQKETAQDVFNWLHSTTGYKGEET